MSEIVDKSEDTRCTILRHATDLFAHYGYAKTNIGDIAKACRMSPGNLYRYFRNKQAIGEETVRQHLADFETRMADRVAATDGPFDVRLRAMVHQGIADVIAALREDPNIVDLANMVCAGDSGILRRHIERMDMEIASLLREGIASGALRDGDADVLASVFHDALAAFWNPVSLAHYDLDRVPSRVDAIMDVMLDGMRA